MIYYEKTFHLFIAPTKVKKFEDKKPSKLTIFKKLRISRYKRGIGRI
jgi:hypothetical protein